MDESVKYPGRLTRRSAFGLVAALLALPRHVAAAEPSEILVHKDPNCSCCTGWVRHLQSAGFAVTVRESTVLHLVRRRLGVPDDLAACHTAEASGYVLEGDRKSTRLNSSHQIISYAVFCLKKKKKK